MAKYFPILLFLNLSFALTYGQNEDSVSTVNKETVLVIPFNRFDFHTEFDLKEIAEINGVETSAVFDLVQQSLLNSLIQSNCENFQFRIISDYHLNYLKRRITYDVSKKPSYYAVDMSLLDKSDLGQLMRNYDARYILFINWYQIKKDNKTELSDGIRTNVMSRHFIDYGVYDKEKKLIAWAHEYTFIPEVTTSLIRNLGLNITELQKNYSLLPLDLCKELGE